MMIMMGYDFFKNPFQISSNHNHHNPSVYHTPFHTTINCKDGNYPGGVLVIYKQEVVLANFW
jgi:hypothetical protein